MMLIIFLVILCILIINKLFNITGSLIEGHSIEEERDDMCKVYMESYINTNIHVKDEMVLPFYRWCYDYKSEHGLYPGYRIAEIVLNRMFDRYSSNIHF